MDGWMLLIVVALAPIEAPHENRKLTVKVVDILARRLNKPTDEAQPEVPT